MIFLVSSCVLYGVRPAGTGDERLLSVNINVGLFSASLFAFILMFASIVQEDLGGLVASQLPRRGLAIYVGLSGLVTFIVWGVPLLSAFIQSEPPAHLDIYTTPVTYALELAIITPATFICAYVLLQESAFGYMVAIPLLTIIILLTPQIALSTVFQRLSGVPFSTGEDWSSRWIRNTWTDCLLVCRPSVSWHK